MDALSRTCRNSLYAQYAIFAALLLFIVPSSYQYFYAARINAILLDYAGIEDFPIFAAAATNFIETGVLYIEAENMGFYGPGAPIYKFPPLYGAILVELFRHGFNESFVRYICTAAQVISFYTAALVCMLAMPVSRKKIIYLLAAFAIFILSPLLEWNLFFLQLDVYLLLLLSLAMLFMVRDKLVLAGLMIGLATALKVYPLALALYFLLTLRWRVLLGIAIGIAGSTIFTVYVIGPDQNLVFLTKILPHLLKELPAQENPYNVSFPRFLMSFGISSEASSYLAQGLFICLAIFFSACHLQFSAITTCERIKKYSDLVSYASLVLLILLFMKNSWWNYQILLILPVIVTLFILAAADRVYWAAVLLVTLAIALLSVTTATQLFNNSWEPYTLYVRGSGPFLLLMVLLAIRWRMEHLSFSGSSTLPAASYFGLAVIVSATMTGAVWLAHEVHGDYSFWQPYSR